MSYPQAVASIMGEADRFADLKLLCAETAGSIMMFEQTMPAGTKSLFHLHRDSDEVAWVLAGEFSFKVGAVKAAGGPGTCAFFPRSIPHAWKNIGSGPGRVLFLYTPAAAGAFIEEMATGAKGDLAARCERHRWEVVGENPL